MLKELAVWFRVSEKSHLFGHYPQDWWGIHDDDLEKALEKIVDEASKIAEKEKKEEGRC